MQSEGQVLKVARINKGFSQEQMAQKLGLSTGQYISNYERNKATVAPKHFKRIARWLGRQTVEKLISIRLANYRTTLFKNV